jgi:hypothetical protein
MSRLNRLFIAVFILSHSAILNGQNYSVPLYTGAIPNSKYTDTKEIIEHSEITFIRNVKEPGIDIYLPSKRFATGQALPGTLKGQTLPGILIQSGLLLLY